jgi:hypothetical protein
MDEQGGEVKVRSYRNRKQIMTSDIPDEFQEPVIEQENEKRKIFLELLIFRRSAKKFVTTADCPPCTPDTRSTFH